jgi:hypothetical protein
MKITGSKVTAASTAPIRQRIQMPLTKYSNVVIKLLLTAPHLTEAAEQLQAATADRICYSQ